MHTNKSLAQFNKNLSIKNFLTEIATMNLRENRNAIYVVQIIFSHLIILDCQNVTEFCTNSVQNISYRIGSSINITSPDYPSSTYSISHYCEINIDTRSTERVGFRIVQRNVGDESSKCQVDYLIVNSSGGLIPSKQISCLDNDNNIIIYGHHLRDQSGLIKFRLPAGSKQGFILTFTGNVTLNIFSRYLLFSFCEN